MPVLRELQLGFAEDVFSGGHTGFDAQICAAGLSGDRRLQVYRHNLFASLTGTLQAVYPVIHRLVGDGFFRYAAAQYIPRHPSTSGNLHDFGKAFPAFLQAFAPAARLVYLPDVARLEWAYHQVFHAADHPPLDPMALAAVPEECYGDLKFRLHPASRLLGSEYPILRIWQVNQEDYAGDQTVNLAEGGIRLLVIRREDLAIEIQVLEEGEFTLLSALAGNRGFAMACERALAIEGTVDVATAFRRHIVQGTLVDFSLG